jgi:CPA1 family monovalent cation:H+ antiporter
MPDDLSVVLLFAIATGVAIAVRRFDIPYAVALALIGVALGSTRLVGVSLLRRDVLFSVFLPALIFEAAYQLKLEELRASALALIALAVPGVAAGTIATAALLVIARPTMGSDALPFGPALVFGAIVAATDPIAVVALFRKLGAPRALIVLVEGESLLNDGTGIAVFIVAMSFVSTGKLSYSTAAIAFVRMLAVGTIVGVIVGVATSFVSRRIDDAMIEITLTVIAAYGAFALAERARGSGVIATVAAAVICGSYRDSGISEYTRRSAAVFWEYAAFAFNSLIFLSMGAAVRLSELADSWRAIVAAYVAIVVTRAALVALVTVLLAKTKRALSWKWSAVVVWGGVRGALSMVLALSLPDSFPHRETIVVLTTGVVMSSLVLQGLSMSRFVKRLGLESTETT